MKTTTLLFFLFILNVSYFSAQTFTGPFSGNVTSKENAPYPNVKVIIYENDLAIDSTYTDSLGNYSFMIDFKSKTEYSSRMQLDKFNIDPKDIFRESTDTTTNIEYILDIQYGNYLYDKFDNNAYYELNIIDRFSNFEIEWFKSLMDEYPKMCLKFHQSIHPKESMETAKKRIRYFENELKEAGYDMNRIHFSSEIFILKNEALNINAKSRIQGETTSMDGKCK